MLSRRALLCLTPALALQAPSARRLATRMSAAPYTLYDLPVSNNGARVRMLLYYKDVKDVEVVSPMELGGLRSEDYLKVNPQGKMPALSCRDENEQVPESDTIARFLGGKFDSGGAFSPPAGSLEALKADRLCRHHDVYLAPIQGCLYKASPQGQVYGMFPTRDAALDEFQKQLQLIERYADATGPYLCGAEPSQADCALFPTLIFADTMLPKFDREFTVGPNTRKWFDMLKSTDPVGQRIYDEVHSALEGWAGKGRWDTIHGAGLRDVEETIFDKIVAGDIPSEKVYEDDLCMAFKDVAPCAPVHILLIPKNRNDLSQLRKAQPEHVGLLGHLMSKVGAVAEAAGLDDYRVVVNDGAGAGQTVFHLHVHVIGGRELAWPPG